MGMQENRSGSYELMKLCVVSYLDGIRDIKDKRKGIEDEIERISSSIDVLGARFNLTPGSPNLDVEKIPRGVIEMMERREELTDYIQDSEREYQRAWELCGPLSGNRYLLWLHYVEGMTWGEVGDERGMSRRSTISHARLAVEELYALLPEHNRIISAYKAI